MNVLEKPMDVDVTIKKGSAECQGLSLGYRLRAVCGGNGTRYEVEVTLNEHERACAVLGDDVENALSCFNAICRGMVTPCTLEEIVREMPNRC